MVKHIIYVYLEFTFPHHVCMEHSVTNNELPCSQKPPRNIGLPPKFFWLAAMPSTSRKTSLLGAFGQPRKYLSLTAYVN